jgi:hypothetical protein
MFEYSVSLSKPSTSGNGRSSGYSSNIRKIVFNVYNFFKDRLCGLVVTVSGYRSSGPGFESWRFEIFWEAVGLKWGPLSLVRTTEELLGRKSSGSGLENRD